MGIAHDDMGMGIKGKWIIARNTLNACSFYETKLSSSKCLNCRILMPDHFLMPIDLFYSEIDLALHVAKANEVMIIFLVHQDILTLITSSLERVY